jgi:hypothetical protein
MWIIVAITELILGWYTGLFIVSLQGGFQYLVVWYRAATTMSHIMAEIVPEVPEASAPKDLEGWVTYLNPHGKPFGKPLPPGSYRDWYHEQINFGGVEKKDPKDTNPNLSLKDIQDMPIPKKQGRRRTRRRG